MTTVADVAKAWEAFKRHRDIECVAMANAEPCECEDEDHPWDRFEEALEDFLHPDDGSMDCSCGRVTLDFFTGTHSMLTKEGERFFSANHRRDRCDREEVVPDPPTAPAWTMQGCPDCRGTGKEGTGTPSGEGGEDFRECFRCQGAGFVPFPAPPAAPKEEE